MTPIHALEIQEIIDLVASYLERNDLTASLKAFLYQWFEAIGC
jgi:hypothetical protein